MKVLTAIPVYNEERHLEAVLREVRRYSPNIVVINDGSTDGTAALLSGQHDLAVITHGENRGYGAALISAFAYAVAQGIDALVTMDCDRLASRQRDGRSRVHLLRPLLRGPRRRTALCP